MASWFCCNAHPQTNGPAPFSHWQGTAGDDSFFTFGSTIFSGIRAIAAEKPGLSVVNQYGFNPEGQYNQASLEQAVAETLSSDVTIVCLSENTYAEAPGDIVGMPKLEQRF